MTHDDGEAGLTLVEIAISLVILGIVLTTFFVVVTGGLQSLSDARARQSASQASTEVIELLRALPSSKIAMYSPEHDPTTVSCGGIDGAFDPDGSDGPLGCESVRSSDQGAILGGAPYQGSVPGERIAVTTVASVAEGTGVPAGTIRLTVVVDYELRDGPQQIRRSTLFSEVSRG